MRKDARDRVPAPTPGPAGALQRRARLFVANVRSTAAFVRRRHQARGAARAYRAAWRRFAFIGATFTLYALLFLDPIFGAQGVDYERTVVRYAVALTDIGQSGWYLVPLGLFLIFAGLVDWRDYAPRARLLLFNRVGAAWFAFLAIGGSGLAAALLKQTIGRARPRHFAELGAYHFDSWTLDASFASFPSGHATTVGAVTASLALLFPRLRLAALVIAVWVGFTRVVVGAHYPSDVVAGLFFGAWFTYFTAARFARAGFVFAPPVTTMPAPKTSFHLLRAEAHRAAKRALAKLDGRLGR